MDVNGGKMYGKLSLITLNEILSPPGELAVDIAMIICLTSSCETTLNANCSLGGGGSSLDEVCLV
jgi:hypothetical protein